MYGAKMNTQACLNKRYRASCEVSRFQNFADIWPLTSSLMTHLRTHSSYTEDASMVRIWTYTCACLKQKISRFMWSFPVSQFCRYLTSSLMTQNRVSLSVTQYGWYGDQKSRKDKYQWQWQLKGYAQISWTFSKNCGFYIFKMVIRI